IPEAAHHGVANVIAMFGNRRGRSDAEAIDNCLAGLNQIKGLAEAQGVTICLELLNSKVDHADYQGDHTAFGVAVMKAVNSPRVKLLYDIYHMQIMEGDIIRTIRDNRDYIAHFHTGGVPWDNARDSAMLTWPYASPRRGRSTKERPFGEFDACIGGWEIEAEPYTKAAGTEFNWWRARMVGGRTNHWGRISLRFGPYDFKRKSRDGLGDDWPISYDDVAPYYDKIDRATGVVYVDKTTGTDQHVRAKVVVLAASAFESARLLFNSRSARFPDGLANSSGTVGKYITDTTGTDVGGFIPKMMDHVPHNHDGVGGMHLYMPWWLENAKLDFPRGYHIEVWGGTHAPGYGFMGGIHHYPPGGGYG